MRMTGLHCPMCLKSFEIPDGPDLGYEWWNKHVPQECNVCGYRLIWGVKAPLPREAAKLIKKRGLVRG